MVDLGALAGQLTAVADRLQIFVRGGQVAGIDAVGDVVADIVGRVHLRQVPARRVDRCSGGPYSFSLE